MAPELANPIGHPLSFTLDDALSAWPREAESEHLEVLTKFETGLSNTSFLIAQGKERLVLRLNKENAWSLVNRERELAFMRQAETSGLGAEVVYCDPDYRFLITRFLNGSPWFKRHPWDFDAISELAIFLKNLHQLPITTKGIRLDDTIEHYWHFILHSQPNLPTELLTLHSSMQPLIVHQQALCTHLCLCHNDPVPANIFDCTGGLRFIDWEYSAPGDPYFDLAVVAVSHGYSEQQCDALLNAYLSSSEPYLTGRHRLDTAILIYRYIDLLWHFLQSDSITSEILEDVQKLLALIP